MKRSPQMQEVVDQVFKASFGRTIGEAQGQAICTFCGSPVVVEDFVDDVSFREWQISGLCQACQDEIFMEEDE